MSWLERRYGLEAPAPPTGSKTVSHEKYPLGSPALGSPIRGQAWEDGFSKIPVRGDGHPSALDSTNKSLSPTIASSDPFIRMLSKLDRKVNDLSNIGAITGRDSKNGADRPVASSGLSRSNNSRHASEITRAEAHSICAS